MNQITYIGNCGIQVEMDGIVIWADPYCLHKYGIWLDTPPEVKRAMETYTEPLKKPDLLLISHIHDDHYNRAFIGQLLLKEPRLLCIAPKLVCDDLIQNGYAGAGGQMLLAEEVTDRVICRFQAELSVEVARTTHIGDDLFQTEHYSYCIDGTKRVIFAGDAQPAGENYLSFAENGPVDLLAAPFVYITRKKYRKMIYDSIRPAKLALIHMPDPALDEYHFIDAALAMQQNMQNEGYQVEIMQKNLQQMAF